MTNSPHVTLMWLFILMVCCSLLHCCVAFMSPQLFLTTCSSTQSLKSGTQVRFELSMATNANNGGKQNGSKEYDSEKGNSADWESLQIRIARMRLEEGNKRRFLKSRAAKLSYEQCKQWAQAQNMWSSKDEWYEWVDLGENLSAYIPTDPEAHYKRIGTWIDWNDFLGL